LETTIITAHTPSTEARGVMMGGDGIKTGKNFKTGNVRYQRVGKKRGVECMLRDLQYDLSYDNVISDVIQEIKKENEKDQRMGRNGLTWDGD
jgi:hypothetical protein